jgi:hypothetical protein
LPDGQRPDVSYTIVVVVVVVMMMMIIIIIIIKPRRCMGNREINFHTPYTLATDGSE